MKKEIRGKKVEMNGIRGQRLFLFLAFFFLALPSWAADRSYPDKPINMFVPWGAGGTGDMSSRLVADKITEFLGQPIISVYKAGGGGNHRSRICGQSETRWLYNFGCELEPHSFGTYIKKT